MSVIFNIIIGVGCVYYKFGFVCIWLLVMISGEKFDFVLDWVIELFVLV